MSSPTPIPIPTTDAQSRSAERSHLHLGIGEPLETSPAVIAAIEDSIHAASKTSNAYTSYPDQRSPAVNIPAPLVFKAIDPDHTHDIPEGLTVLATNGIRSSFYAYLRMLDVALKDFNEATREDAERRGQKHTPLVAPIILPIPTFDEFVDVMKGERFRFVLPQLREEEEFAFTDGRLLKEQESIFENPDAIPGGYIHISPHSPEGRRYTRADVVGLYRAGQSLNDKRMEVMIRLAGGQEPFEALKKSNAHFSAAVDFLSRLKILEDGAYFGTEEKGYPTTSFQEIHADCPEVADDVITAFGGSKTGGAPEWQFGVAICGPKIEKWFQDRRMNITVGLNRGIWAAIHAVFDPRSKYYPKQLAYLRRWKARLQNNRALLQYMLNGTSRNGANDNGFGRPVTDPATNRTWAGEGIEGVRKGFGGRAGMFAYVVFDKGTWGPLLPNGVPFDKALYAYLRGSKQSEQDITLTPPWKTCAPEGYFRIKLDVPESHITEAIFRLHDVVNGPRLNGARRLDVAQGTSNPKL